MAFADVKPIAQTVDILPPSPTSIVSSQKEILVPQLTAMSQTPGPSTGVFYAYAKYIGNDTTARYLITFATRETADTWYRAVVGSVSAGYKKFASVKRVSPQFYTFDVQEGEIRDTITDSKVAPALHGQVFFTLLNDRDQRILSMIPVLNYRDHINGDSFSIRSVTQPDTYWYYDTSSNTVLAHRSRRSLFTITIADSQRALGAVIIGTDQILITTATTGVNIGINCDENRLNRSANPFSISFSSFKKDFHIGYWEDDHPSNLGPIIRSPGKGEMWELV
ncbi:hypothetical protein FRB95_007941 [Tulasnella sp. JGI-2019a]|nr:hypothetical protein FRB95_007941 [Tulasnella sp. JGI-2019a]